MQSVRASPLSRVPGPFARIGSFACAVGRSLIPWWDRRLATRRDERLPGFHSMATAGISRRPPPSRRGAEDASVSQSGFHQRRRRGDRRALLLGASALGESGHTIGDRTWGRCRIWRDRLGRPRRCAVLLRRGPPPARVRDGFDPVITSRVGSLLPRRHHPHQGSWRDRARRRLIGAWRAPQGTAAAVASERRLIPFWRKNHTRVGF